MTSIEIDEEVMAVLTSNAKPFVDTPNSVLRRLLGIESGARAPASPRVATAEPMSARRRIVSGGKGDRGEFIRRVLGAEFSGEFRVRSPYQMMFESANQLVYFQNFNAPDSHNLWYRLNPSPMKLLRKAGKSAYVCLTNPAEGFAYLLPLRELDERMKRAGWTREEIEVNIDPITNKWREFDWDLRAFRKTY